MTDGGDTGAPIVAAIDVGTNTTRMLVSRIRDGRPVALASSSAMTALGEGLERTGVIPAHAMVVVEQTVAAMAGEARALGASPVVIACTAVAREAENAADLLSVLERATGIRPRVLSGPEEAALTFAGLGAADRAGRFMAVDLGGGSLELMGGNGGDLEWVTSLPIGVRKMTERYEPQDPPALDLLGPMSAFARSFVEPLAQAHPGTGSAIATGGSAVALGVLAATPRLDRDALVRAVEVLASAPAEDIASDTGLEAARLRLCLAGAAVLEAVRRAFGVEALEVSAAGLREGLVMEAAARGPASLAG